MPLIVSLGSFKFWDLEPDLYIGAVEISTEAVLGASIICVRVQICMYKYHICVISKLPRENFNSQFTKRSNTDQLNYHYLATKLKQIVKVKF